MKSLASLIARRTYCSLVALVAVGALARGAEAPRQVTVLEPPGVKLRPTTTGEP